MLNGYIFVCDHAVYLSVVADHRVLHQDGVLDHGALADLDALKDNAVLYRAVNDTAVGHQRVLGGGIRAVQGGHIVPLLGRNGLVRIEQTAAALLLQHSHGDVVIALQGLNGAHKAVAGVVSVDL